MVILFLQVTGPLFPGLGDQTGFCRVDFLWRIISDFCCVFCKSRRYQFVFSPANKMYFICSKESVAEGVNLFNNQQRVKAMLSSLKFEPFADQFLAVGIARACAYCIRRFKEEQFKTSGIFVFVCFTLQYKLQEQT